MWRGGDKGGAFGGVGIKVVHLEGWGQGWGMWRGGDKGGACGGVGYGFIHD